jgi:hypothetical protein
MLPGGATYVGLDAHRAAALTDDRLDGGRCVYRKGLVPAIARVRDRSCGMNVLRRARQRCP